MAKKKKPKRREPEPAATDQPLVFLDIDGVLAPFGGRAPPGPPTRRGAKLDADAAFAPFDERCVERLAAIVEATGAAIILSSSWRARPDAVAVIERRFRAFGPPLSEKVPLPTTDIHYHGVRQWEIARYLEKRPARRWVALDDLPLDAVSAPPAFVPLVPPNRFVRCDDRTGLTPAGAARASGGAHICKWCTGGRYARQERPGCRVRWVHAKQLGRGGRGGVAGGTTAAPLPPPPVPDRVGLGLFATPGQGESGSELQTESPVNQPAN